MVEDSLKTIRNIHRLLIVTTAGALVVVLSVAPQPETRKLLDHFRTLSRLDGSDYRFWAEEKASDELRPQLTADAARTIEDLDTYDVLDYNLRHGLETAFHLESSALPDSLAGPWAHAKWQEINAYTNRRIHLGVWTPAIPDIKSKLSLFLASIGDTQRSRIDDVAFRFNREEDPPVFHLSFTLVSEDGSILDTMSENILAKRVFLDLSVRAWLRHVHSQAITYMTDNPNPSASQVYVPPELRSESVEEVIQKLKAKAFEEGISSRSLGIGGTSIPGRLILVAIPALFSILNLYLLGHLSHFRQTVETSNGISILRNFAWLPLSLRGRAWLVEPLLTITLIPAAVAPLAKIKGMEINPELQTGWFPVLTLSALVMLSGLLVMACLQRLRELLDHHHSVLTIKARCPAHPGEILKDQFLDPHRLSHTALAKHLGIPVQRVNEIVEGRQGVSAETAWLLSQAFETTPDFWLNLQAHYDLAASQPKKAIPPLHAAGLGSP